ncbi:MAG: hypothetical protein ABI591_20880 [Kofleriaceae bacterium]
MTCSCVRDQLCDSCIDAMFAHLRGTAACRGERWSDELAARRRGPWILWPVDSERVRIAALERVEDLTRDPRLRERLSAELVGYAAKRWNEMRPDTATEAAE